MEFLNSQLREFKREEYQTALPVSWEICLWVKKQQIASVME